eukprot:GHVP01014189.1.p1 GENE.GHVP01014189.1~~GHVP01014189.1.p1  ORF type:complete len:175 (-),score=27.87 GHVP01014189.1:796-1320(-)
MKNKQLLFEASLTAASGVARVSVSQESSCSGPTAYLPSVFHYDDAMSDQPIVTYCGGQSLSEEDTKYFKQKFEIESKIKTMAGEAINLRLTTVMEKVVTFRNFERHFGFSYWKEFPGLIIDKIREVNLKDFQRLEDLIKNAFPENNWYQILSLHAEKTNDGRKFLILTFMSNYY